MEIGCFQSVYAFLCLLFSCCQVAYCPCGCAGGVKLSAHRAGPFDRAHGPERAEGLPGKVLLFVLCPLTPV